MTTKKNLWIGELCERLNNHSTKWVEFLTTTEAKSQFFRLESKKQVRVYCYTVDLVYYLGNVLCDKLKSRAKGGRVDLSPLDESICKLASRLYPADSEIESIEDLIFAIDNNILDYAMYPMVGYVVNKIIEAY